LLTGSLTAVLVGVTSWYVREARTPRLYEEKRRKIAEVCSPLIKIVEEKILNPYLRQYRLLQRRFSWVRSEFAFEFI